MASSVLLDLLSLPTPEVLPDAENDLPLCRIDLDHLHRQPVAFAEMIRRPPKPRHTELRCGDKSLDIPVQLDHNATIEQAQDRTLCLSAHRILRRQVLPGILKDLLISQ